MNDVVLATVAGARAPLSASAAASSVQSLDFRVMAPVSVRTAEEHGTLGNRVSAWMVPMPLAERDPRAPLEMIRETTAHLKESKQALGAEVLTQVGEWTPSTLLSLGARMATRALPFNLVVTNVPGPQVPLYMLGAQDARQLRLRAAHRLPVPRRRAVQLRRQAVLGLHREWDLLPDLHDFVVDIEESFQELRDTPERIERATQRARRRATNGLRTRRRRGGER